MTSLIFDWTQCRHEVLHKSGTAEKPRKRCAKCGKQWMDKPTEDRWGKRGKRTPQEQIKIGKAIYAACQKGLPIRAIVRHTGLHRDTVRRYVRLFAQQGKVPAQCRCGKPYLHHLACRVMMTAVPTTEEVNG